MAIDLVIVKVKEKGFLIATEKGFLIVMDLKMAIDLEKEKRWP